MKSIYLLLLVGLLFAGCKKSDTTMPTPYTSDYFVEYTLDGQKFTLTRSALIGPGTGVNETKVSGDNGTGSTYRQIRLNITGVMNGKPETKKIRGGDIIEQNSIIYEADLGAAEVGSITFTEVTAEYAVGTFMMNLKGNGRSVKITDGKFKVMF
ncbi:hypothetical protein G8759_14225 [Spirosoma aureum]|uniref:Lipocalin-like domain-containing protein n=1 Tax=Spirosoma aureum TaxID=2692134 RepID=A0A6G9AMZ6_9BACT|nr:hypothetical protein [Spirosoma aureum]QIP13694.1 hypothetical protein G8759_14225 [Spirosoma aureum]